MWTFKRNAKISWSKNEIDQIAEGTLGINKSGDGMDAVRWWREGEIEKVKNIVWMMFALQKIYMNMPQKQQTFFKEGPNLNEIKLDTSSWKLPHFLCS